MSEIAGVSPDREQETPHLMGSVPVLLWQQRWLVIIPAAVIALSAIMAAFLLPPIYRAKAVLLVESQSLPDSTMGASLDNVIDRRIAKIRQQILSRPDLVGLIQANNLYNANDLKQPLSKLVDRMRNATDISAVDADISKTLSAQNSGSIAFQLTFDYPGAADAQLVAQTYVDRLLKLDAARTQSDAQSNVNFLQDQQTSLQSQVSAIESQINQIASQNGAVLAGAGGVGSISIGGGDYESQIATLRRENAQLQAQLGGDSLGHDPGVMAAEAQLAAAHAQYADTHPDVKLAQIRLAAAKANAKNQLTTAMTAPIQQQISANNQAIAQLDTARGAVISHATALAAAQSRGPVVAQQVAQLAARADQVRGELGKVSASLLSAQSVVKLATEQRGERLTLIEPPVTPDTPSSPNRLALIIGGILGGIAVGIGLVLALEMIYRPIRSVSALTIVAGAPPLAVIPVLSDRKPKPRWKLRKKLAAMFRRVKSAVFKQGKEA